jgi:hypothetical protein
MRWCWAILLVMLVAGCAEVEKQPEPEVVVEVEKKKGNELQFKSDKLKYLAKRKIEVQPTRPLNVRSRCSHRDAVGTTTKLDLQVKDAVVKSFDAQVAMKGYGACSFKLKDFDQAEKLPQALLKHKTEEGCSVRMWEQGAKVTVAFSSCPKSCERDAFSYLWPIMIEAKSGRCF